MEPWEVMISESQERMIAIVRPQMLEAVEAVLDRWELRARGDRRGDRDRRAARVLGRRGRRRDPGAAPHRRVPALRGRADARAPRLRRARSSDAPPAGEALVELLASPALREPRVRLSPLRPARRLADRAPAGPRRGRAPAAAVDARARALARRPGPHRASRPVHGRRARGARGRAQRRVRRRRADRLHGLPQLRQPGEARDRLGARAGDRRHRGGVRGARRAGRVRQRLALQRDERSRDPSDAGRRRGRSRRGRAPRPEGLARRRRRSSPRSRRAPSLAGSEYQARYGEVGGTPAPLDLDAEARLVSFLWQRRSAGDARPRRLRRRARRLPRRGRALLRARGAALDLRDDPVELFGEVGGRGDRRVRAGRPRSRSRPLRASSSVPLRRVGDRRAGVPCSVWSSTRLRSAWEVDATDVWCLRNPFRGAGRRRVSRTSGCSRSSTAARSRPGSRSRTAGA